MSSEQQEAGVQPKVLKSWPSKHCEKGSLIIIWHVVIKIHARHFPLPPLWRPVSFTDRIRTFPAPVCICSFCLQASKLHRVHCSLLARPQTLVANTVSAAQRSIKRFGGCTLQIIVYLLPHLWYSVSVRIVEGSLWTWSSWPSLGAKISLPLRPARDPFEAVYATCLKKQWLE